VNLKEKIEEAVIRSIEKSLKRISEGLLTIM